MNTIVLAPIGPMDDGIIASVSAAVWNAYGVDVERLDGLAGPEDAWDEARGQFSSELILRRLVRACPSSAQRILGVTSVDLFIPMLSFVFGQAQLNGKAAVASTARLDPAFYGLPADPALTVERLHRESIHELGHTFGLTHCLTRECPMSLATDLRQLDQKGPELCRSCRSLLRDMASAGRTPRDR